jgi:hypothetical protein
MRVVFWADVIVLFVNLLFLYSWMFEQGFLPDWQIISQLFFFNTVLLITKRRVFSPPKGHYSFQIIINAGGIILEDHYVREVIARERLQAVVMPPGKVFLSINSLGLVIENRLRILPEHFVDQARLVEELAGRFSLPRIDRDEAVRRGWHYSPLKIIATVIGFSFITVLVLAGLAELTAGPVRLFLCLLFFLAFMLVVLRFVSSFTHRRGAVVKRRNRGTDLILIPLIAVVVMTLYEAANMTDKNSSVKKTPAASSAFSSRLSAIDPPPIFSSILTRHVTNEEIQAGFAEVVAEWSRENRSEYERKLVETAANPQMISAQLAKPSGESAVDLSLQPIRQVGRRHSFFHLFAPSVEKEETIVAMVRILCLCAAELDAAQPFTYPGFVGIAPGNSRIFAAKLLRQYLAKSTVSRQTALELLKFSRKLETVLPDAETLLAAENYCWGQRLRMRIVEYQQQRTNFSRASNYPDPDDKRVLQLRKIIFEKPLPVLQRYEKGLVTFPAILRELELCRLEAVSTVESWGWRVFDTLLLPYEFRYLIGALDCSYDWPDIWENTINGRQHLHALGYIAAISAFQAEKDLMPVNLNELCTWLASTPEDPVKLPRDLFTGLPLLYDIASGPRLFSAGPDGRPATKDDIVLYP